MKRTILWKPRRWLFPPFPSKAAAAATTVTIETSPQTLSAETPLLSQAAKTRGTKGAPGLGSTGRHPPGSPGANLERLSRQLLAPRLVRLGPGLTGGARRAGGSGARRD